jgi:putative holliday junction resolvase
MTDDLLPPRVLAIDPGQKRIGLAISDPFGNFAVALETIPGFKMGNPIPKLEALCKQYDVADIVLGLPLHMNGDEGEGATQARELAQQLTDILKINVTLLDERLTSKIAERMLREQGVQASKKRKSGIIDQSSAMLLLQDFLDRRSNLKAL